MSVHCHRNSCKAETSSEKQTQMYVCLLVCLCVRVHRAGSQRYTWPHITAVKMSLDCLLTTELMWTTWPRLVALFAWPVLTNTHTVRHAPHCNVFKRSQWLISCDTSQQPRRQPYWYHPRVVRLSVIGHSQWLPHGLGTLYRRAFSFRLPPRTEDRSVPVVVPGCDLTMYCALSARPSLSADLSLCTGRYKLILLILYGGLAAAVDNAT